MKNRARWEEMYLKRQAGPDHALAVDNQVFAFYSVWMGYHLMVFGRGLISCSKDIILISSKDNGSELGKNGVLILRLPTEKYQHANMMKKASTQRSGMVRC